LLSDDFSALELRDSEGLPRVPYSFCDHC
jgi:hypothetical protein